jgi:hypothetical protein
MITNDTESLSSKFLLNKKEIKSLYFGITLFLYFSLINGFMFIGVSYLYLILPATMILVLGLGPVLVFIIPDRLIPLKSYLLPVGILTWLIAVFLPSLSLRMVFVIFGMVITYLTIRHLFLNFKMDRTTVFEAIIIFALLEFGLKASNRGIDPIIQSNFIQKVIVGVAFVALIFLMFRSMGDKLTETIASSENLELESKPQLTATGRLSLISGLIASFLWLMLYNIYFSNPGSLSLSHGLSSSLATFRMGLVIIVTLFASYLVYVYIIPLRIKETKVTQLIQVTISGLVLITAIYMYPWYGNLQFLFILGLFVMFPLLSSLYESIVYAASNTPNATSGGLALGIIFMFGLTFELFFNEAISYQLFFAGFTAILSILAILLKSEVLN